MVTFIHDPPGRGIGGQERGHISRLVKIPYFFENLLLFSGA